MLSNRFQSGLDSAKLRWSRLPISETGTIEIDGSDLSNPSNGGSVESLDYEIIENSAYREEQAQRGKLYFGYSITVKWLFALLIGIGTGLAAFVINLAVENFAGWKFSATFSIIQHSYFAGFLVYTFVNLALVFYSAIIVTQFAPAAAGSGIPEIKGYLNGIDTPGILLFRTLIGKILGSIGSVGGGLALGKEGPLVHTGACIASLLGQGGSTKYHLSSRWLQVFKSDRDRRDLVLSSHMYLKMGCDNSTECDFRDLMRHNKVKCRHCSHVVIRGITILKQHLGHASGEVSKCDKISLEVSKMVSEKLENNKQKGSY